MADKHAVLSLLRARPESWLSAAEIRSETGNVPERTLRNWLTSLIEEGAIEFRGERKGRQYRLRPGSSAGIDVVGSVQEERSTTTLKVFSPESLTLIRRIEAPIYTRPPATYREDWLESYVPNQSAYLTATQRKELAALGKRDPIYGQARTYIKKIYDRLLIDFSFNSSRLEGNTYSLADTERLVLQGAAAPGNSFPMWSQRSNILTPRGAVVWASREQSLRPGSGLRCTTACLSWVGLVE